MRGTAGRRARTGVIAGLLLVLAACGNAEIPRQPQVVSILVAGSYQDLEIHDETGELINARAVAGRELELVLHDLGARDIGAFGGAVPKEVRLAWLASSCETRTVMTIAHPNRVTVAPVAFLNCDDRAQRRALVLVFRDPVDVPGLRLDLRPALRVELQPIPGEGLGG